MECLRAVESAQAELVREHEENAAWLGGSPFGSRARQLTDDEKRMIVAGVLEKGECVNVHRVSPLPPPPIDYTVSQREPVTLNGGGVRGRAMTAAEYLAHVVYGYCAAPGDTAEETTAKAHLELACMRLGVDVNDAVADVMRREDGGRVVPPWDAGTGG